MTLTSADVTTPGTCAGEYSVTRTWTATDACGNSSTASQTITVTGHDRAGDRGAAGTEHDRVPGDAGVRGSRRRRDCCDASVDADVCGRDHAGHLRREYSVTRTWTATDACGNTSTASQTINGART